MDIKKNDFEKLVRENKDTIYTVCYMFSKDQDEVADLYQETLINLWKGLSGLKEGGNVKGWVYRVSLNTCISLDRKKRSRPTVRLTTSTPSILPTAAMHRWRPSTGASAGCSRSTVPSCCYGWRTTAMKTSGRFSESPRATSPSVWLE